MTTAPHRWLVVAGGGTAGHVLPALAVADTLVSRGVDQRDITFIGSQRGIEKRIVPEAGYGLTTLSGRGLLRSFSPSAILANLQSVGGLVGGTLQTIASFAKQRPAIVLSVGGYASVPACIAARITRVPLVLAESNAYPGRSVKAFHRYAKAAAVAFPDTGLASAVITGNPVRREILALADEGIGARVRARNELAIKPDQFVVTVFGGSLGAKKINQSVLDACPTWANEPMLIHHVVGERDLGWAAEHRNRFVAAHPNATLTYQQVAYENHMPLWYAASDLVVCRAGATSVADLAVAGIPAILIPLPTAAEDHQTANAKAVVSDGGAVLLPDVEVTAERLLAEIDGLRNDPARREAMAAAQRRRARPEAGDAVADLLLKYARVQPSMKTRPA